MTDKSRLIIDYTAIGSIIIDDIVDPQGQTSMGTLGGGGSHAIAGMRVWSKHTALVSVIGEGFPEAAMDHLTSLADISGILTRPVPQPRFWQLFETNGTRNEVPRTDFEIFKKIPVRPDEYPEDFASVKGVYLQTPTADEGLAWAEHLKRLNPDVVILWEPWEIFYTPENLVHFQRVAASFDIVSPQTVELSWMIGETDPQKQADILFECGVNCLALRMGADGSLVSTARERHHIPAITAPIVDATGAGNAYCGGFIVGYVESGGNSLTAGRYGTVSATFTLAQVGIPHLGSDSRVLAKAKLQE